MGSSVGALARRERAWRKPGYTGKPGVRASGKVGPPRAKGGTTSSGSGLRVVPPTERWDHMASDRAQIKVRPREGQDAPWRAAAAREGISLNEWILQALDSAADESAGLVEQSPEPSEIPKAPAVPAPVSGKVPIGFAPPAPPVQRPAPLPRAPMPRSTGSPKPRRAGECGMYAPRGTRCKVCGNVHPIR